MMNRTKNIFACLIACVLIVVPWSAFAQLQLRVEKGENDWVKVDDDYAAVDLEENGETEIRLNRQDCKNSVSITVEYWFEGTPASDDLKMYVFLGDSCNASVDDECEDYLFDPIALSPAKSEEQISATKVSAEIYTEGCTGSGSTKIWLAALESEDLTSRQATPGNWKKIDISWNYDVPDPPTGVSVTPGNGKLVVKWDRDGDDDDDDDDDDDEDVDAGTSESATSSSGDSGDSFYAIYYAVEQTDTDTGSDSDTATDTEEATDPSPPPTENELRALRQLLSEVIEEDGVKYVPVAVQPVPLAADQCPDGDFSKGDDFDPKQWDETKSKKVSSSTVTLGNLENGTTYNVAVVAVSEYGNISKFSEVACGTPGETESFLDEMGANGDEINGEFCFIATAAFGSYDHSTVRILRRFRDEFLGTSSIGRGVIAAYYKIGPYAATMISGDDVASAVVRMFLTVFAFFSLFLIWIGPLNFTIGAVTVSVLGAFASVAVPALRRK